MLPQYFQDDCEGGMYFTEGDRISGTVSRKGAKVTYRFNSGDGIYEETFCYRSQKAADRAAAKIGAFLRREGIATMATARNIGGWDLNG